MGRQANGKRWVVHGLPALKINNAVKPAVTREYQIHAIIRLAKVKP